VKTYRRVAAFILAGGASSRMGRDKGLIELASVPLVVRTALLLDRLVAEVTVVGAVERYLAIGLKTIADQSQGESEGVGPGQ
jgi:molybdenum cofactor guanylyltransferase